MQPASAAISGFTSVLTLEHARLSATCSADITTNALLAEGINSKMVAGPGVALLAGMLTRLGISCSAQLECAVDAPGILLRHVMERCGPGLRTNWRSSATGHTNTLTVNNWLDAQPALTSPFEGSDFCLEGLPILEPASRAMGIWCYPASGVGRSRTRESAFRARMVAAEERGTTQIMLLGAPLAQREGGEPWQEWLRPLLRHTDVLCAQADALLETLDPEGALELSRAGTLHDLPAWLTGRILHDMSGYLMDCGVGVAVIDLAGHGVYLRSNRDSSRVAFVRKFAPDDRVAAHLANWTERDMLIPPFAVEVANRYASSDALCAGIVTSIVHGLTPGEAIRMTAAVMGFAAESVNPIESVDRWDVVQARVEGGWAQGHCLIDLSGWSDDDGD